MTRAKPLNIRETIPAEKVKAAIEHLTSSLMAKFDFRSGDVVIVGIHTQGAAIAERVANQIRQKLGVDVQLGVLDITFYRDDFGKRGLNPVMVETRIDFDIDDKKVVLFDDVLFTGRTIRAALDELMDYGRPSSVTLAVLIDRGHRELPIAADIAALKIQTKRDESVVVHLEETDRRDEIIIGEGAE